MLLSHHFLLLLLSPFLNCIGDAQLTVINLANGGTSRPLKIGPLDYDHSIVPPLKPQLLNAPPLEDQSEVMQSSEGQGKAQQQEWENVEMANKRNHTRENSVTMQVTYNETNVSLSNTSKTASMDTQSTSISTSTSTSMIKITTKISSTTPGQPEISQDPTASLPPHHLCHQSCLEALNSTHLKPNNNLILSAGSSLTLECHMPMVDDLFLEELLWLFHPGGSPEGRCSLTPNKYLHSCPGFPALSETDYSNATFLRQILTLSSLRANHTGDYMCQVRVTCCSGSEQHFMTQQQEAQVSVMVWWAEYDIQLAVTGVMAAALLLVLIGGSLYSWRLGRKGDQYEHMIEVEAQGVLHLPLIDDQDTDSFDSSITDKQE